MKHAVLRKVWISRITAFKQSGENIPKWCARHNLKDQQLRYWLRKLETREISSSSTSSGWFSVDINPDSTESTGPIVVKVGQVDIEVKPEFNPELLTDVVKALRSIC